MPFVVQLSADDGHQGKVRDVGHQIPEQYGRQQTIGQFQQVRRDALSPMTAGKQLLILRRKKKQRRLAG